ncbi:SufB/SufD family protein [Butyrivibrio sp. VCD2006]|uniref:SufB/SufD family protein n=1 Tax=Butyrivibrio sp. VCD2006 TaxID=1280664 RepID=UPI000421FAFD|nr:SufD family Fe-S cluster assembly protein [Butyrivibrio sp. VCD2006]
MDLKMKVNHLPALTYRFLKSNDSEIDAKDLYIENTKTPDPLDIPEGVSVKSDASEDDIRDIFAKVNAKIEAKKTDIPGPNGDTAPLNDAQTVRTGMGVEIDKLMNEMNVKSLVITSEEGRKVTEPVHIKYDLKDGDCTLGSQVIYAKKDSEITVIMEYDSEPEGKGFLGLQTRLLAEEGAKINLVKVQMLSEGFIHFDDIGSVCDDNASVDTINMQLGAGNTWGGNRTALLGDASTFDNHTGYLCRNKQSYDMNYVADQMGKKTQSNMIFRGVLLDEAVKTFRGTLDFKAGSAGSVGDEQEDTLLLSPDVINRTMPVILCGEEDVDGRHGASIGQLGDDTLFYMESRGIDEEAAKKLMIRARMESIARMIPDEAIIVRIQQFIRTII